MIYSNGYNETMIPEKSTKAVLIHILVNREFPFDEAIYKGLRIGY